MDEHESRGEGMNSVLIVDDNKEILAKMHAMLAKYAGDLEVVTANNGKVAMRILAERHIDLLVTDLVMPEVDGLTLLAHINDHYPHIQCIAMTGYVTDNMIKMLPDNLLQVIRKPFKIYDLINTIRESLKTKPPAGTVCGISLPSFLQLIEMDEKTCALDVTLGNNQKGTFLFKEGVLYDAFYEDMTGEGAAVEILRIGEKATITLKTLPVKNLSRQINTGMMQLLLNVSKLKDDGKLPASGCCCPA